MIKTDCNQAEIQRLLHGNLLPSPKGAAVLILDAAQQDNCSLEQLAPLVQTDPAFTAKLIAAANIRARSGLGGAGRPVASIPVALQMLGLETVRRMALTFSLIGNYSDGLCASFGYKEFWSRSLMAGVVIQELASRSKVVTPDEGFCLGLLSYIGELGIATAYPKRYSEILRRRHEFRGYTMPELERKAFGISSLDLTGTLLGEWGFPKLFADAANYFDDPTASGASEDSREYRLCETTRLARVIANYCLLEEAERPSWIPAIRKAGAALKMGDDELSALCRTAVVQWRRWGGELMVYTCEVPEFDAVAKRQQELAAVVEGFAGAETTRILGNLAVLDDMEAVPTGYRVLVVDDDRATRLLTQHILEIAGHQVFLAENGADGFQKALEIQPHLMVIDWVMPGMDGITLTKRLRETNVGKSIYMLLLTGRDDEGSVIQGFQAGVDDYMPKPIREQVFMARLLAASRVIELQEKVELDNKELRRVAAELAAANRHLKLTSFMDVLTELPNRRYFDERMAQAWSSAQRSGAPLSVMVIDVDEFKTVNDKHGHAVGDQVLKQVGKALRKVLRQSDLVARVGGDEFYVICPGSSLREAMMGAMRLCVAIREIQVVGPSGEVIKTSTSIGVATYDKTTMPDLDTLIQTADKGAYVVKKRGRNNVASVQVTASVPAAAAA